VVPAEEITDEQGRVRRGVDDLIAHWLASRPMSEMKFMVLVHPFSFPKERRYVVAEQDGQVVGFAAAVPVYAQGGWFLEDLLRLPDAPNGTAELLVDAVMRQLDDEGCRYATLGLAPLAGEVNTVLRLTRDYTAALYNFGGVRAFKAKLRPHSWEPLYLAWPRGRLGLLAMRDALAAFAPGGMIRFGLNTLVHERSLATFVLGLLLVPWTFAVGMVDTAHWFPSAAVQQAWVVFDLLLIVLLFALVQRWRSWLAGVLAALTTADAALTLYQVATHNVARVSEPWEWLVLGIGVSGPLIAATFLWATRIVAVRSKLPVARRAVAG
jgi:phosphatidylglycerol lysyltransferase